MAKNQNWTKKVSKSGGGWHSVISVIDNPEIPENWQDDSIIKLCYICGGNYAAGAIRKNKESNIEIALWNVRTKKLVKKLNLNPMDEQNIFIHLHNTQNPRTLENARVLGINPSYENIQFENYCLNLSKINKLDRQHQLVASMLDSIVDDFGEYVIKREGDIDLRTEQREINKAYSFSNVSYRRNYVILPEDMVSANIEVRVI